jgi:membrane-associated phospholipid phosphatase
MEFIKEKVLWVWNKLNVWAMLGVAGLYYGKLMMYKASNRINTDFHTINMAIDDMIPFCKYFLIFYVSYYWFPELLLWLLSYVDKRKFYRLLISISIACLICNICFAIYQVKMIRPEVIGNDLFSVLMRVMYDIDKEALNCFPSIHSLMGTAMIIGGFKTNKFPKWFGISCYILGIGCILSTVFIKQHYFIDMVVGVLLMIVVYIIVLCVDNKLIKKREN